MIHVVQHFNLILTECCGKNTFLESGSSGCISFSVKTDYFALIVRNEMNVLCITYHEIIHTIPDGWNRSFTCTYSNSTLNFNLCISDLKVTDAGLFSLKISNIFVQNVTLQIQGKTFYLLTIDLDFKDLLSFELKILLFLYR